MNKVIKIAKKLKNFTLDDLIIMGDLDETVATAALNALVAENKIQRTGKYFEYIEAQVRKENYKIFDKRQENQKHACTFKSVDKTLSK